MKQSNQSMQPGHHVQEVLKPILYTDIFDYPLTFEEVYKFLEVEATPEIVKTWLDQTVKEGQLIQIDGFYSLASRAYLADKRQERQKVSDILWPQATHYGRWIAALPFVKMVAITGSLAVNNPRHEGDDIDYLIVTRPGRLWLCRAMIILMVKYGYKKGVHLCPNYLITENVLDFDDGFYTAREVLQMKPLYGQAMYREIRNRNTWATQYFPQGGDLHLDKINENLSPGQRALKKLTEITLAGFWGNIVENQLQKIQITKHRRQAQKIGVRDKVIFTADVCKGHYDGHNNKTMIAYQQRIQRYFTQGDLPASNGKVGGLEIK